MTIIQLLYALEVGRCHSFSKAADALFVSQPALSLQMKKLESELGYELFHRTPKGVLLTELGEQFCRDAKEVVETWETFESKVMSGNTSRFRRLRIGMGARVYSNGLFDDIVHFFDQHPNLEVTFVTEAGQDFLSALCDGSLDLALDRLPRDPQMANIPGLVSYDLIEEQQCILMAHSDPKSTLPSLSFQDLQGCTAITGLENSIEGLSFKQECKDFGITPNRIYRSDGIDTNMSLVRAGKGYVIGPLSFGPYYNVAAVPLTPPYGIWLKFICLQKNTFRTEISAFRKYIQHICWERRGKADEE